MSQEQEQKFSARDAAIKVVRVLQEAGHVAYFAGGCVRDGLLGKEPKDFDVATDALPETVVKTFRSARFVGEAFGVALVRLMGHEIQVATFRSESDYADGRHPGKVVFTNAREDALRRDFTINGMFEDPAAKDPAARIIDYVDGLRDLEQKVIRAIGTPADRFAEDYLRMLRAVRFAARMGFEIEPITAAAIRTHARYLGQISRERIGQELGACLAAPGRARAALLVQSLNLDGPALNEEHKNAPLPTLKGLGNPAGFGVALAAWTIDRLGMAQMYAGEGPGGLERVDWLQGHVQAFVDRNLSDVAHRLRGALALSNQVTETFSGAFQTLAVFLRWRELGLAQKKRLLAGGHAMEGLELGCALSHVAGVGLLMKGVMRESGEIRKGDIAPEPFLTGADLIALGMKPGPGFKKVLDEAYDLQLGGAHLERDAALAWLVKRGRA
jgi:poly(A) polymerase